MYLLLTIPYGRHNHLLEWVCSAALWLNSSHHSKCDHYVSVPLLSLFSLWPFNALLNLSLPSHSWWLRHDKTASLYIKHLYPQSLFHLRKKTQLYLTPWWQCYIVILGNNHLWQYPFRCEGQGLFDVRGVICKQQDGLMCMVRRFGRCIIRDTCKRLWAFSASRMPPNLRTSVYDPLFSAWWGGIFSTLKN